MMRGGTLYKASISVLYQLSKQLTQEEGMEDPRKCATCRKYWESLKQCRPHAPAPIPMGHNRMSQQTTMWLEVDGSGCDGWVLRDENPSDDKKPSDED